MKIPKYVDLIINRLESAGYEAYIVGGAIRNTLLNKEPKDYDIATNAIPEEIEEIFNDFRTIVAGKEFGTIVVSQKEGDVEITTFRREGDYIDGRRPEWVSFSNNIIEDLSRRDFTINAMAYNVETGLVDPFDGKKDLEKALIKTVGDPEKRFQEDYLRILRSIRFSSELGFTIEENTFKASKKYVYNIEKVSAERIREEFFRIILSEKPSSGIMNLEEMGALNIILKELSDMVGFNQKNPHHKRDLYGHTLCVLDKVDPILNLRLAALFHDIGKPHTQSIDKEGIAHYYNHHKIGAKMAEDILKRFKASNELINKTTILILEHMNHHNEFSHKGLKRLIRKVGEKEIFNLFSLQKADIKCSNPNASIDHIIEREKKVKDVLDNKEAIDIFQLDINGKDLIEIGFKEGKIIGETLDYLLDRVMEEPALNQKEILRDLAKGYK